MLIDSHCHLNHLDLAACGGSVEAALQLATEAGIQQCICIGLNQPESQEVLALAEQFSSVYATVGVHPNEPADGLTREWLIETANHPKVVAIGECGLDDYRDSTPIALQKERFILQLEVAKLLDLPVVVHTRDTTEDTLALIKASGVTRGVLHCFTGTVEQAMQAIALGFCISFSGIITFKNAKALQQVAKQLPLSSLLVETDSPYLAPHPFRGKPNHPAHVRLVAEKLAELKELPFEKVAEQTSINTRELFALPTDNG